MWRIFSPDSPYKRQARFAAILWTLLIFVACFTPGKDIPDVQVPFIDKWTHFILFGGFTFLWMCYKPVVNRRWIITLFLIAVGLGSLIEILQGILTFLGRDMEFMDAVADSIGGLLGIVLFLSAVESCQ
jgi:VanZ family protein